MSQLPPRRAGLRKRKAPDANSQEADGLSKLLAAAATCHRLIVFSGSGLSATSGMSTFSTPGGLYERAQQRFHVADGKKLFTYSFYEKRKLEALAFFADIYSEAKKAAAGAGHKAIADICAQGKLVRHYTLNIDGLAEAAGMSTWHPHHNPDGVTVEMHGSIRQLVCPGCGLVSAITPFLLRRLKAKEAIPCTCCACTSIRIRIMLYDDAEDDVIIPEDLYDRMDEDVKSADMILWVGISFEQSASTAYFRRVRHYLNEVGRLDAVHQAVINPSDESLWNLLSACSNTGSLDVVEVLAPSDEVLPLVAAALAAAGPAAAEAVLADAVEPAEQTGAHAAASGHDAAQQSTAKRSATHHSMAERDAAAPAVSGQPGEDAPSTSHEQLSAEASREASAAPRTADLDRHAAMASPGANGASASAANGHLRNGTADAAKTSHGAASSIASKEETALAPAVTASRPDSPPASSVAPQNQQLMPGSSRTHAHLQVSAAALPMQQGNMSIAARTTSPGRQ